MDEKIVKQYFDTLVSDANVKRNMFNHDIIEKNIQKMIRHQGFVNPTIITDTKQQRARIAESIDTVRRLLVVQFFEKVGVVTVRNFKATVTNRIDCVCVVPYATISRMAENELYKLDKIISIIKASELHCWCVDHQWVPRHRKLNPVHDKVLIDQYESSHLPTIAKDDIIVRVNGWVPGDIIHIRRHCDVTQEYQNYYRVVR